MSATPHIVIAGGGMVGLSLALLLEHDLGPGVSISVIEGVAPRADGVGYHPSFDNRSTALSFSTAAIYRELGIWSELSPGLGPIESIHVSRRGRFGSSLLTAEEQAWDALGWVVENPCLGQTLLGAIAERPSIELICPERAVDARPQGMGMEIDLSERSLHSDLLVVADGAESQLREKLGFFTRRKKYGQQALITNVAFEKDHRGCAYERFTASGPLALLPLPPTKDEPYRMALVWTLPPADAEDLLSADDSRFAAALLEAFGYRLGRVQRTGQRHAYPLTLTEAVEQVRRACVILGNAAHALHPVAGQGFNLALRDAAALSRTLADTASQGLSLGDTAMLETYSAGRQRDQAQTIAASDGLPSLFMISDPLISLGRDLALSGLDLVPILRREFVHQAAGMAALEVSHG